MKESIKRILDGEDLHTVLSEEEFDAVEAFQNIIDEMGLPFSVVSADKVRESFAGTNVYHLKVKVGSGHIVKASGVLTGYAPTEGIDFPPLTISGGDIMADGADVEEWYKKYGLS